MLNFVLFFLSFHIKMDCILEAIMSLCLFPWLKPFNIYPPPLDNQFHLQIHKFYYKNRFVSVDSKWNKSHISLCSELQTDRCFLCSKVNDNEIMCRKYHLQISAFYITVVPGHIRDLAQFTILFFPFIVGEFSHLNRIYCSYRQQWD